MSIGALIREMEAADRLAVISGRICAYCKSPRTHDVCGWFAYVSPGQCHEAPGETRVLCVFCYDFHDPYW